MSENLNIAEETIESGVMYRSDECRESALYGNTDQMREYVEIVTYMKNRSTRERMTNYFMKANIYAFFVIVNLALSVVCLIKGGVWYAYIFNIAVLGVSLGGLHLSIKSYLSERKLLLG